METDILIFAKKKSERDRVKIKGREGNWKQMKKEERRRYI